LSKVAVVVVPLLWAVTARPMYALLPIAGVRVPTLVHAMPSGETSPLTTVPDRVRRSQYGWAGKLTAGPDVQLQPLPVGVRH
jgi:hypothetical protein